ncbi:hypothetical protein K438DRAFT_2032660 [Mycena galopus ATCC 62051]|nr:hypothetical protein K438DRAFT_2032660 [Mycena galopus ATCC 62051]
MNNATARRECGSTTRKQEPICDQGEPPRKSKEEKKTGGGRTSCIIAARLLPIVVVVLLILLLLVITLGLAVAVVVVLEVLHCVHGLLWDITHHSFRGFRCPTRPLLTAHHRDHPKNYPRAQRASLVPENPHASYTMHAVPIPSTTVPSSASPPPLLAAPPRVAYSACPRPAPGVLQGPDTFVEITPMRRAPARDPSLLR